jgi:DNA-binding CsgD family transcriptional regulator
MRIAAELRPTPVRCSVAVSAADPARLAALTVMVEAAGYAVVSMQEAQLLLCDGEPPQSDKPAVVLGVSRSEYSGVLPADATAEQVDAALRAVAAGLIVRAPSRTFAELRDASAHELLTPRELQVLAAIGNGASNKAIARQLGISLHTVKFHIESLFRKLSVRSRAEAVAKGLERRVNEMMEI